MGRSSRHTRARRRANARSRAGERGKKIRFIVRPRASRRRVVASSRADAYTWTRVDTETAVTREGHDTRARAGERA